MTRASKYMALLLRHNPSAGNLVLDSEGWTPVQELLGALQRGGNDVTLDGLKVIVASDAKGRYSFSQDGLRIRANQGHSAAGITLTFERAEPPAVLYHGTIASAVDAIMREGLSRMHRHHVHLSGDLETAKKVGGRRGKPVVLKVDAARMRSDGHVFYRSANGVWLVDVVPPEYLSVT
jgi:putative RNA 2'-phosphotransferase